MWEKQNDFLKGNRDELPTQVELAPKHFKYCPVTAFAEKI